MAFFERLQAEVDAKRSFLCVGLDPRGATVAEAERQCLELVEQTARYPNVRDALGRAPAPTERVGSRAAPPRPRRSVETSLSRRP